MDEKVHKHIDEKQLTIANVPLWKAMKDKKHILSDPLEIPNTPPKPSPVEFLDALDIEWLNGLVSTQKQIIQNYGKKLSNKVLVVLDDSISSKVLRTPVFRNFLLNSRHYNVSTIFVSQSYILLDRNIRINNSFICLHEVANLENLKQIYNENPSGLDWQSWLEVYQMCITVDYGFLSISYQNDKRHRLIRNFEEFLIIEEN